MVAQQEARSAHLIRRRMRQRPSTTAYVRDIEHALAGAPDSQAERAPTAAGHYLRPPDSTRATGRSNSVPTLSRLPSNRDL